MTCLSHPDREVTGTCELCAQPHCGECLRAILGRWYCPPCAQRVSGLAGITPQRPSRSGESVLESGPTRALGGIPGWLSALLYLIGFYVIEVVQGIGVLFSLAAMQPGAFLAGNSIKDPDQSILFDPGALGLGRWAAVWIFWAWAGMAAVLLYTLLFQYLVERKQPISLGFAWRGAGWRGLVAGPLLAGLLFVSVAGVGIELHWYRFS